MGEVCCLGEARSHTPLHTQTRLIMQVCPDDGIRSAFLKSGNMVICTLNKRTVHRKAFKRND